MSWTTARPARRHLAGATCFGVGWAVAASCLAPIAAQLAQGVWWSLFTLAGVSVGTLVYQRRAAHRGAPAFDVGPDTPAGISPLGPRALSARRSP